MARCRSRTIRSSQLSRPDRTRASWMQPPVRCAASQCVKHTRVLSSSFPARCFQTMCSSSTQAASRSVRSCCFRSPSHSVRARALLCCSSLFAHVAAFVVLRTCRSDNSVDESAAAAAGLDCRLVVYCVLDELSDCDQLLARLHSHGARFFHLLITLQPWFRRNRYAFVDVDDFPFLNPTLFGSFISVLMFAR